MGLGIISRWPLGGGDCTTLFVRGRLPSSARDESSRLPSSGSHLFGNGCVLCSVSPLSSLPAPRALRKAVPGPRSMPRAAYRTNSEHICSRAWWFSVTRSRRMCKAGSSIWFTESLDRISAIRRTSRASTSACACRRKDLHTVRGRDRRTPHPLHRRRRTERTRPRRKICWKR
jgi:hypothetical protein